VNERSVWIRIAQNVATTLCTLAFILSLAGVIFYDDAISQRSQTQAIQVDAAERERMLSQRVPELLLAVQTEASGRKSPQADIANLLTASEQFDTELNAFVRGGILTDSSGAQLNLDPLPSGPGLTAAQQAQALWQPLARLIEKLKGGDAAALPLAVAYARKNAGPLLDQTTALSLAVRAASARALVPLTAPRNLFGVIGILGFVAFVGLLFLRVQEGQREIEGYAINLEDKNVEIDARSRQLAEAQAGTDLIMNTVTQGLLLIDPLYRISSQYSREVKQILRLPEPAGVNFLAIMQRILTEKMYNTTKDYLALLFDSAKKERAVLKVNPLDEVEVNFPDPQGGFLLRFLEFTFRRIYDGTTIPRVFVAVTDVTARVQLENRLRESEQLKRRQFELLLSILHVDPVQLDEFIKLAEEQLHQINAALKTEDLTAGGTPQLNLMRERLNTVFRCVHNIKGNAAYLHLDYFQEVAEQFETKLSDLRSRKSLSGDDFLAVAIAQSQMRSDLEELGELREKLVGIQRVVAAPAHATPPAPGSAAPATRDDILAGVEGLARSLALKLGKEIKVETNGFDTRDVAPDRRPLLRDVLIQLTRNSLAHGVEDPQERLRLGKPRSATISIRKRDKVPANFFGFTFRDDGHGLDPVKIRSRAVESGLLTDAQARSVDDSQLASLIFAPGFSTRNGSTAEAGRGMGMDIIKQRVVDEWGGEISVQAVPGRFCEFSFMLPK